MIFLRCADGAEFEAKHRTADLQMKFFHLQHLMRGQSDGMKSPSGRPTRAGTSPGLYGAFPFLRN